MRDNRERPVFSYDPATQKKILKRTLDLMDDAVWTLLSDIREVRFAVETLLNTQEKAEPTDS